MLQKDFLKQLGKGILMFLIFYYSAYFQYIPIILFRITKITPQLNVVLSAFSSIMVMTILFIVYRDELRKEWNVFKKNFSKNMDTGFRYWIIGVVAMFILNMLLNTFLNSGQASNEQTVQSMISALPFIMLFDAGIVAPFNEEIIFRKCFKKVFKNKWVFAIASGFVFGLLHVLGAKSIVQFLFILPYGFLGAMFALMYYDTDTVFTSMTIHALHNTILILFSITGI